MTPPTILHCRVNDFTELLPGKNRDLHRFSFDKTWTAKKMTHPMSLLLLSVFVAMGTCLPSLCLATKGGIHIVLLTFRFLDVAKFTTLTLYTFIL
jgi:hypothetical protein